MKTLLLVLFVIIVAVILAAPFLPEAMQAQNDLLVVASRMGTGLATFFMSLPEGAQAGAILGLIFCLGYLIMLWGREGR